ncbi:hypothetical protein J2776_005973 [Paraburkholderia caledonica]|uniref:Uncharacterized protein n=1 Tax=Paraburkholderia caledonica TaxID=134536 RepID=A0ABU1L7P9_9BURK|nr:hypothetical protein [Paraburkholderia caledonica]
MSYNLWWSRIGLRYHDILNEVEASEAPGLQEHHVRIALLRRGRLPQFRVTSLNHRKTDNKKKLISVNGLQHKNSTASQNNAVF